MKKLLFVGTFIMSALTFSANTTTEETQNMMHGKMMSCTSENCSMMNEGKMGNKGKMMDNHMMNMTPEMQKEMQKDNILIKEKNLEVQKAMLENKVDWSKIEKLNKESAEIKANLKTKMMKSHYEMMKSHQTTPATKQ
ncbi:hypothetical protein [uncultured Cetobacterium sp.]|uniref:hypothetical protein n=1 Tax=uncultured Cetobacterium sp. TaxID=527638 RepID=UPI00261CD12A|nr:hypothetical protein [uncultured Cetobacterium sp.]